MGVLQEIRRLPESIQALSATIQQLAELHRETGPAEARLEELERSRATWEAEMEALLLKADSTLKSANNAESRARTMVKAYEKLDPFREGGEEVEASVHQRDAPTLEEEGVQPVHLGLAPNNKAHALRAKWMV